MGTANGFVRRLTNYDDPRSVGSRLRSRRSQYLVTQLEQVYAELGAVRVIDIGGTRAYWNALPNNVLNQFNVHVTVVNLPGEAHPADDAQFSYKEGDGCTLDWVADRAFDIAHANSVLEHVGNWSRMCAFAGEVRRVARGYVVQTPYFWFPLEPHFMAPIYHWVPESVRAKILLRVPLGHTGKAASLDEAMQRVQSAQLVDATMFGSLFPDAEIRFERVAGLPKSLMGIRSAMGGQPIA